MELARPHDKHYKAFLWSFISVALLFDCLPLYPPWLVPQPLSRLQAWYMQVFNDKLLAMPQPAWFRFFSLAELLFQLPCAAYAACLLSCGSGSSSSSTRQSYAVAVPVMLVFGTVSAFATATCVWDIFRDDDAGMTTAQKAMVGGLYSCYGVVFAIMAVDMFLRVKSALVAAVGPGARQKKAT